MRRDHRFFHRGMLFAALCSLLFLAFSFSTTADRGGSSVESLDPYHYHTYQELTDELHAYQANYSSLMTVSSLGTSYEGRDIWVVKLSDNVDQQEDEPGVLFMGAHHGNEKPSYEVCLFFIRYMVEHYDNDTVPEVREALNTTQIYLIPMVNPDGVEADTRKNCVPNHGPFGFKPTITSYGVNLNRNYADQWFLSYLLPVHYYLPFILWDDSGNYRGPSPFSENETRAVRDFVLAHDLCLSLSYHTFGEFIVYPWMHSSQPTPDEPLFRSIGENITQINHYTLYTKTWSMIPRLGGTLGSSENWLYREKGILAYTVELCTQRAPTNPQVVYNVCMTHTMVHLYLCQRAQTIEAERHLLHQTFTG
ncbi:MAG: zinc carboxypeptidase [Candidatus Thermoplasmatota archaeon]|nr:zinc carboxypeptidase [Candidatus Thermoplasmatota archaeon]